MSGIREVAKWYFNVLGLSIVPLKSKKPIVKWSEWRHRNQTEDEFGLLPWDVADGIALIGGSKTLGGLYFISVDYDVKGLPEDVVAIGRWLTESLPKTRVERTPSGGEHWVYLCKKPYDYIKRYHGCCAIEILGSSWLTIMYPSAGYSVLNEDLPSYVEDLDFLIDKMDKYDVKKVFSNQIQNSSNLMLVSGFPKKVYVKVTICRCCGKILKYHTS